MEAAYLCLTCATSAHGADLKNSIALSKHSKHISKVRVRHSSED